MDCLKDTHKMYAVLIAAIVYSCTEESEISICFAVYFLITIVITYCVIWNFPVMILKKYTMTKNEHDIS